MSNLLDKASIILTPTAYNNGEALCVKPSDGSGDFDFSRNSAATRVNAQGLVENVQILSGNLVQNGDFSEEGVEEVSNGSFSQEGVEQITNGSFDTDSNWTKGTGFSISGGSANCDGTQSVNTFLKQQGGILGANIDFVVGKTYKVNFDIIVTSGQISNVEVASGYDSNAITTSGNHTTYITAVSTNDRFTITANPDFIGSIDNVSVREVGQDWTLGTGWSIGEDKAVSIASGGGVGVAQSVNGQVFSGKTYKVEYTILDYVSGNVRPSFSGGGTISGITNDGNGTYVQYLTLIANSTTFSIKATGTDGGFTGSITNISVKEVGQNWDLGTGWSIGDGKAVFNDTANGDIRTTPIFTAGNKYRISLSVSDLTSGTAFFALGDGGSSNLVAYDYYANGDYTFDVTAINGAELRIYATTTSGSSFSIDNVSVIEITDDTNLPRINYEGFSYQDALGSELSSPLDFLNKWFGAGATSITNNSFEVNGSGQGMYFALGIDKEYKIKVSNVVGDVNVRYRNGLSGAGTVVGNFDEFIIINTFGSTNPNIYLRANSATSITVGDVSVKEYLGQEVVPDSGCGSWLWEPQTTQLVTYSEDFSNAAWNKNSVTLESGYLAPDGTNTAFKVDGNNSFILSTVVTGLVATSTRSIYARTVSGTGTAQLLTHNSNTDNIFTITEQWQRFEVSTANASFFPEYFYAVDFRGSGTLSEIILWGANATNDQDYATSYIPTSGSTVTRNQDVCTNGGSLSSINSTEGVLYAEIAALANDGTLRMIVLNDGTQSNRVGLQYSSTNNLITAAYDIGGAGQASLSYTLTDAKSFNKIAFKYKQNDFSLYVNGIEVATDVSGNVLPANTLNNFEFEYGDNRFFFYGKTKALAVWKEALSDEELTELTTI